MILSLTFPIVILSPTFPNELCAIARKAGDVILSIKNGQDLGLQHKGDGSPVTRADHAAQDVILEGLRSLTPDIPIISEEMEEHERNALYDTYWLVDPLDGTRDFITGRNDFSVNIGLIVEGVPFAGVIYAPARDDMMFGRPESVFRVLNQEKRKIDAAAFSKKTNAAPRLILSIRDAKKNPTETWLSEGIVSAVTVRASAYKLLLLACGEADVFLRTSVTYEWDTAAGDAILRALGGKIITDEKAPLAYGKPGRKNGNLIAARADIDAASLRIFFDHCKECA